MGIYHDVKEGLEKYEITKIDGQPTDEDLNLLTKELTNAAGSVATQNGGREQGHVGMVVEEAGYVSFSRNAERFLVRRTPDHTQQVLIKTRSFASAKSRNTRWKLPSMRPTSELKTFFAGVLSSHSTMNGFPKWRVRQWDSTTCPQRY